VGIKAVKSFLTLSPDFPDQGHRQDPRPQLQVDQLRRRTDQGDGHELGLQGPAVPLGHNDGLQADDPEGDQGGAGLRPVHQPALQNAEHPSQTQCRPGMLIFIFLMKNALGYALNKSQGTRKNAPRKEGGGRQNKIDTVSRWCVTLHAVST
jgi:hypothetical protein